MAIVDLFNSTAPTRKAICELCGRDLLLSEATIGTSNAEGASVLVHEAHRHDTVAWVLFWASYLHSERERAKRRFGRYTVLDSLS